MKQHSIITFMITTLLLLASVDVSFGFVPPSPPTPPTPPTPLRVPTTPPPPTKSIDIPYYLQTSTSCSYSHTSDFGTMQTTTTWTLKPSTATYEEKTIQSSVEREAEMDAERSVVVQKEKDVYSYLTQVERVTGKSVEKYVEAEVQRAVEGAAEREVMAAFLNLHNTRIQLG